MNLPVALVATSLPLICSSQTTFTNNELNHSCLTTVGNGDGGLPHGDDSNPETAGVDAGMDAPNRLLIDFDFVTTSGAAVVREFSGVPELLGDSDAYDFARLLIEQAP